MSLKYKGVMKENELSIFAQILVVVVWIIPLFILTLINIANREVKHPGFAWLVVLGFVFFLVGKLSVITRKKLVSFGPRLMNENMANVYRVGYFFMILGIMLIFT